MLKALRRRLTNEPSPSSTERPDDSASRDEHGNLPYTKTGPNKISYWACTKSFGSAILPTEADDALVTARRRGLPVEKFKYGRPLQSEKEEIRLLHLLPGLEGDPVRCELRNALLGDNPVYRAAKWT